MRWMHLWVFSLYLINTVYCKKKSKWNRRALSMLRGVNAFSFYHFNIAWNVKFACFKAFFSKNVFSIYFFFSTASVFFVHFQIVTDPLQMMRFSKVFQTRKATGARLCFNGALSKNYSFYTFCQNCPDDVELGCLNGQANLQSNSSFCSFRTGSEQVPSSMNFYM